MGVAGLWDILRPAGQVRSLSHLALQDGFNRPPTATERNSTHHRGFRIGIDASIWFFHAAYGREGENPELRTLFFRCARLMHTPFLPLFVFDGPMRPGVKRGKRIGKEAHWLTGGMKNMIEAFGFEWRTAPGEAEAELAYLNRIGVIDGILSDDVDNFLFGATFVIRNPSATLTGNTTVLPTANHTTVFSLERIQTHSAIGLTRGGLILIGLLSGGDYHKGLDGCGMKVAVGLAKCGFGDTLVEACERMITVREDGTEDEEGKEELELWLMKWRGDVARELASNSMGHLPSKRVALSRTLIAFNDVLPASAGAKSSKTKTSKSKSAPSSPTSFPDLAILLYYTRPLTSETYHKSARNKLAITWTREPDLGRIAGVCELYFEWGWRAMIVKRFKTVLWDGAVCRILRRAVVEADRKVLADRNAVPSTPSKKRDENACGTPSKMIAKHFSSQTVLSPSRLAHPTSSSPHKKSKNADHKDREALIIKIHTSRTHKTTDGLLEYRLEVAPAQLVRLVEAGITGSRKPPDVDDIYAEDDEGEDNEESDESDNDEEAGSKKKKKKCTGKGAKEFADPESHVRIWMPACMVRLVEPELVAGYEEQLRNKEEKKAGRGKGRKKAASAMESGREDSGKKAVKGKEKILAKEATTKVKAKASSVDLLEPSEEEDIRRKKMSPVKSKVKPVKAPKYVDISEDDDSMDSDKVRENLKGYFAVSKPAPSFQVKTNGSAPIANGSNTIARSKPLPIPHRPLYASDSDSVSEVEMPAGVTILSKTTGNKPSPLIRRISDILSPAVIKHKRNSPRLLALELRPFPMAVDQTQDKDTDFEVEPTWAQDVGTGPDCDDPFLDADPCASPSFTRISAPVMGPSKQARKKISQSSSSGSNTESLTARAAKSPRKSKNQTSPMHNRGRPARPSSPSPVRPLAKLPASRPVPTPTKPKVKAIAKNQSRLVSDNGIIEISSGDEAPLAVPSRKPMKAPLLLARAKTGGQNNIGAMLKVQKPGVVRLSKPKPALTTCNMNARPICDDIIDLT